MIHRACPNLVPRNNDLKKLFDRLSMNFWYGVEEDGYLEEVRRLARSSFWAAIHSWHGSRLGLG